MHAEAAPLALDLGRIEAGLLREGEQVVQAVDRLAQLVEAVEGLAVHPVDHAQRLPGVVDLLVELPARAERGRHAVEVDVGGQLGDPGLERGLERVAVRAAVPEELDDLDPAGLGLGQWCLQLLVVLAFHGRAGRGECQARQAQAGQRGHAGHASQLQG